MLDFTNDGDVDAQLKPKLAESLWWVIVLADRLGSDINSAFAATMDRIEAELHEALTQQEPWPRFRTPPASRDQRHPAGQRPRSFVAVVVVAVAGESCRSGPVEGG